VLVGIECTHWVRRIRDAHSLHSGPEQEDTGNTDEASGHAIVPYSSAPTTLTSAFFSINGVVLDKSDNVFFGDAGHGTVQEFVLTNGSYGATLVTVSTGHQNLQYLPYLAIDSHGRVYTGDIADLKMLTP
jgi:hypothetical protein